PGTYVASTPGSPDAYLEIPARHAQRRLEYTVRASPTRRHTLWRPSSPLPRPRLQLRRSPPPPPPASIQFEWRSPAQPQSSPTRRGSVFRRAVQRLQELCQPEKFRSQVLGLSSRC